MYDEIIMNILAIYGSPREGGNSDTLLDEFAKGAELGGASIIKKYLRDMEILPCTECEVCYETGICIYDDDYQEVFNLLEDVDAMIISSPIFFYGVPAIVKAFIDRSQQFYARKYMLNRYEGVKEEDKKLGYFMSVGATKGKRIFDGPLFNVKYFYDALNFNFVDSFLFRGLDSRDAARENPEVLKECFEAGKSVAKMING
jgi:multimeric flavodoxin WrbA